MTELVAVGNNRISMVYSFAILQQTKAAWGGMQSRWGGFRSEGIVARPAVEPRTRSGHRIITKVKSRDFPYA